MFDEVYLNIQSICTYANEHLFYYLVDILLCNRTGGVLIYLFDRWPLGGGGGTRGGGGSEKA